MNATEVQVRLTQLQEEAIDVVRRMNEVKRACTHSNANGETACTRTASGRLKCSACREFAGV